MVRINHDCSCKGNPLLPTLCTVTEIREEAPGVKTFRLQTPEGKKPFAPLPGQLAMISVLGVGEGMFSITAQGEDYIESAIKECGVLTDALHSLAPGATVGVRGPYGNHFPYEELKGSDLLFVGGGIGTAPVRSLIRYCLENRKDYGHIDIVFGARTMEDMPFKDDVYHNWPASPDTSVYLTVDKKTEGWDGHVGFVPQYVEELKFSAAGRKGILCGPPIMINLTCAGLQRLGFERGDIITTLEMRMKCGIGKCGRCNIGSRYICLDGPVFTMDELADLPDEK